MRNTNPVVAANDALHRPSGAARVYERITGESMTGEGIKYHVRLGRLPSLRTEDGQTLLRHRDVVAFAEERKTRNTPVELAAG